MTGLHFSILLALVNLNMKC
uniref:Uncharacterized protein n=1 Tax=Anguilla anguilla TaxID=7936 RepID=A0A0E9S4T0_ANGAN